MFGLLRTVTVWQRPRMRQGWTRPQIARGTWNQRDRSVTHARPDVQRRHDRADARIGRDVQLRRTCATTTAGHGHHHDLPERSHSIQIRTLTGHRLNEKVIGVSRTTRADGQGPAPAPCPGRGAHRVRVPHTRNSPRVRSSRSSPRPVDVRGVIGFPLSRCLTHDAIANVPGRRPTARGDRPGCARSRPRRLPLAGIRLPQLRDHRNRRPGHRCPRRPD